MQYTRDYFVQGLKNKTLTKEEEEFAIETLKHEKTLKKLEKKVKKASARDKKALEEFKRLKNKGCNTR